ncbi:MAG: hypothetical protein AB7W16_28215 [Candidatus Obscuribacterales bacterium]
MKRNHMALMAGALMLAVSASALPASACDGKNWNSGQKWNNGQKWNKGQKWNQGQKHARANRMRHQRRMANNWQNQVYGQPINYPYYNSLNSLNNVNNPYYTPVSNGVLSNLLNYF